MSKTDLNEGFESELDQYEFSTILSTNCNDALHWEIQAVQMKLKINFQEYGSHLGSKVSYLILIYYLHRICNPSFIKIEQAVQESKIEFEDLSYLSYIRSIMGVYTRGTH